MFDFLLSSHYPTIDVVCVKSTPYIVENVVMASKSINSGRGNSKTQTEYPLIPKTLGEKGMKLLANAQRAVIGPSR